MNNIVCQSPESNFQTQRVVTGLPLNLESAANLKSFIYGVNFLYLVVCVYYLRFRRNTYCTSNVPLVRSQAPSRHVRRLL